MRLEAAEYPPRMATDPEHPNSVPSVFQPPPALAARAHIKSLEQYRSLYRRSIDDPKGFWSEMAGELSWEQPFTEVVDWNPPFAKWFIGGRLNASVQCLDRHLATRGSKRALIWESEQGQVRTLTYAELHDQVCRLAQALKGLGVVAGDRVGIYLPLIPEALVSMLACARLGATHVVVFGGFSAEALRERMADAGAKVLITADGGYRRGQVVRLKEAADQALKDLPQIRDVVVILRTGEKVALDPRRDHLYADLVHASASLTEKPAAFDSEQPLFVLYTSGTTGKPKGVVHTTAGYLLQTALSTRWVFDLKEDDVYWCTADVGWITGHSYVVYGPLAEGATVLLYEGALNFPTPARVYELIQRHRVSILYTAPTAIRSFRKAGDHFLERTDLLESAAAGLGRRADQSSGLALVSREGGWGPLPDCGHLVADRDRVDRGLATAGSHAHQAWLGGAAAPRLRPRGDPGRRKHCPHRPERQALPVGPVAVDASHLVGRRRALPAAVLERVAREILHRRRRPLRRGRLPVGRRPHR